MARSTGRQQVPFSPNILMLTVFYRCGQAANQFCCTGFPQLGMPAMASYREMDAVGRDPARFILLAKQCLLFPDLTEWERDFLETKISEPPDRLSTRQFESLFEIRDKYELHSRLAGGFSVATLLQRIYEARFDLSEDDEDWIVEIWQRSPRPTKLPRHALGRVRRCAEQIGAIEPREYAD